MRTFKSKSKLNTANLSKTQKTLKSLNKSTDENFVPPNSLFGLRQKYIIGLVFAFAILAFITISGLFLQDHALATDFSQKNLTPCINHPFGTDWMGRDMLVRTLCGLSLSIRLGVLTASVSALIALLLGTLSALLGRTVDSIISWIIDLMMGIPHIILLILISYACGKGFMGISIGIIFTHWMSLARVIRAEILQLKQSTFVQVAEKLGKTKVEIAIKHLFPHVLPQFIIGLVLLFPHAILHESSITFLGFGLSPEQPAIGIILAESMRYLSTGQWWIALFPGLLLVLIVILFDKTGKTIRVLLDPRIVSPNPFLENFATKNKGEGEGEGEGNAVAPLLEVRDLSISFARYNRNFEPSKIDTIQNLNLTVQSGEIVAVVGASGSGKSLLAHSILGILPKNAHVNGAIYYNNSPLAEPIRLTETLQKELRGREIVLVPQSVSYLDPLMRTGRQLSLCKQKIGKTHKLLIKKTFSRYGLPENTDILYPFELSGGMARRVLISSAVIANPKLVIADEPTPGLHLHAARRVLSHFREMADDGAGVLLITHDLELALECADRLLVFYNGQAVEEVRPCDFKDEKNLIHPYTKALWHALPQNGFDHTTIH